MKSTKHNSREKQTQSKQKLRAAALRALNGTALKAAKGGVNTDPPPPSSDPIC